MALTGTKDVRDVTANVLHAPRHGDVVRPAGGREAAE
jgi:L-lactate dehydrogenase (cytochrome)